MGWNPGQKAAMSQVMLKTDPGAYFYGRLEQEQEQGQEKNGRAMVVKEKGREKVALEDDRSIVSMISAIRFGDDQAWLGYYITEEQHRGKGYGLAIFNHALEHLGGPSRKSIGLNAVMSQVPNYQKSGFTQSSWTNERRRGPASDIVEGVHDRELAKKIARGEVDGVVLLSDPRVDWDQLHRMEKQYTGFDRPEFIKSWADYHANGDPSAHRIGVAILSTTSTCPISKKPLLLGYTCARPAMVSYRIGPLYATDGEIARQLLVKLAVEVIAAEKRSPMRVPLVFDIDIVQENTAAVAMFDRMGWPNLISSLRMWKGVVPPYDASGCFGIATAEAG
ncbi:hypothetical protein BG015_009131 [Linnemannia schmuckeri]|uniref:N-acetyltransferase domain-containing protein n=1 Tax=Linnemannia schmuckeri TaxID=64567 RepID=A0A9P5RY36_9FUNG|nr:hypothetical protein BG015_009131 [Linnemannia schmuckeri]